MSNCQSFLLTINIFEHIIILLAISRTRALGCYPMKSTFFTKILVVFVAIICIIVAAIALEKPSADTSRIKIGALIPLSGPGATLGEWMRKGALAAQDEINATGGINGRPVELIIEDDKCNGPTGIAAYRKLYDTQQVRYFAGPLCAAARIPVLKNAESDDSLIITTGLAVVYGQETTAKTFNVLPSVGNVTETILNYGFETMKIKRVSLLTVNDEIGKETEVTFDEIMARQGITQPHIERFTKGTTDMRTEITKIINDKSDAVLVVGFTADYAVFMKQAADLGLKKTILAISPVQAPDVAHANIGTGLVIYYPHPSATQSESATTFLRAYQEKDPSASVMSPVYLGSGYDAVKIIAHAIETCDDDIECAQDTISHLQDYPGANGAITFGEKGNVNNAGSIEIRMLKDGVFSAIK